MFILTKLKMFIHKFTIWLFRLSPKYVIDNHLRFFLALTLLTFIIIYTYNMRVFINLESLYEDF